MKFRAIDEAMRALMAQQGEILGSARQSARQKVSQSRKAALGILGVALLVMGLMAWLLRRCTSSLQRLVGGLGDESRQVSQAATQISTSSQALAQEASDQAASLDETSASSAEINASAKRNAETKNSASALSSNVDGAVGEANRRLDEMQVATDSLSRCRGTVAEIREMNATDLAAAPLAPVELAVIVPAFNERENVDAVVAELKRHLAGIRWEVIFVDDDSPDKTAEAVREASRHDARVRCIQRIGRRGLSTACIEGMLASTAPFLAVMDADLQHDPALLPKMLAELRGNDLDIVVGSRYISGGGIGEWKPVRAWMSKLANKLSQSVLKAELSDRMSGYFMLRREVLAEAAHNLSGLGFKILLDLFASSPRPLRHKELPYTFRQRVAGESKLDSQAVWSFLMLLLDKAVGRVVPVRLVSFVLVGAIGVGVHMAVFLAAQRLAGLEFVTSQVIATLTAMVSNFAINNMLTYRDIRLRGGRWALGLLTFMLACSVGAITNVHVASLLVSQHYQPTFSALAGVLVSTVWNYAVTATYTWGSTELR